MTPDTLTSSGGASASRSSRPSPSEESPPRRRAGNGARPHLDATTIVAVCTALHLLAAAAMYRDVARDLYALFDATPRLLVLERGLVRLTAISVFLPPFVPTALLASIALWLGNARRDSGVTRWLALAAIPLALDSVLRAIGVVIAPAPSTVGELLELPNRFSPGPLMLLDALGVRPSPAAAYWVVVCTVAAVVSAWCVARALIAAESCDQAVSTRRRPRATNAIDALRAGTVVVGIWCGLAASAQLALPWATQLVLRALG